MVAVVALTSVCHVVYWVFFPHYCFALAGYIFFYAVHATVTYPDCVSQKQFVKHVSKKFSIFALAVVMCLL